MEAILDKIPVDERVRLQAEGMKIRDSFVYTPPYHQETGPFALLFRTLLQKKERMDRDGQV